MMDRGVYRWVCALVIALVVLGVAVGPGLVAADSSSTSAGPTVSVSDGSAAPGETVTVDVSATDATVLSLAGIPPDWKIEDYDENGGLPQVVELDDGTQKIQWAWSEDGDRSVSVTLSVSEGATAGETELTAEAGDTEDRMVTATGDVSVAEDAAETTDDEAETTTEDPAEETDGEAETTEGTTTTAETSTETADDSDSGGIDGGGVDISEETTTEGDGTVQTPVDPEETENEASGGGRDTAEPETTREAVTDRADTPDDSETGLPVVPIVIVVALGVVASLGVFVLSGSLRLTDKSE